MAVKPRRFSSRFGPDFGFGRYCVATINEGDDPPPGTIGTIRLWGTAGRASVLVHITRSDRGNTTLDDENAIGAELLARMTNAGVDFANYGDGRTFHCDVQVPDALIARYA